MCTLQILYLSKEQFVDGIFALLPNPISPKLYEPQGVLCGGVWTLKSHDCKMLCSSLLNYTCQSLIDCPFVCLSSVPGSAAIIPLWIRQFVILRQWNVIPWLSFFYFFFFIWFGRLPHCAVTPWEHQIVPATHVSLQSNIWIQHLTATAAGAHSCKSWMFEVFWSFLLVLIVQ